MAPRPRPRTIEAARLPDLAAGGRRTTMAAKFSAAEVRLIDAARGEVSRSEWLRDAALTAAQVLPAPSRRAILEPKDKPVPRVREAAAARCVHPVNRRIGDYCAACGSTVKLATFCSETGEPVRRVLLEDFPVPVAGVPQLDLLNHAAIEPDDREARGRLEAVILGPLAILVLDGQP